MIDSYYLTCPNQPAGKIKIEKLHAERQVTSLLAYVKMIMIYVVSQRIQKLEVSLFKYKNAVLNGVNYSIIRVWMGLKKRPSRSPSVIIRQAL